MASGVVHHSDFLHLRNVNYCTAGTDLLISRVNLFVYPNHPSCPSCEQLLSPFLVAVAGRNTLAAMPAIPWLPAHLLGFRLALYCSFIGKLAMGLFCCFLNSYL